MVKLFYIIVVFFLSVVPITGEPLILEQPNQVLSKGKIEFGITEASYGWQEIVESSFTTSIETRTYPLYLRICLSKKTEITINIPSVEKKITVKEIDGTIPAEYPQIIKGMLDTEILLKLTSGEVTAFAVKLNIPTGTEDKFRRGYNILPMYLYKNLFGGTNMVLNINIGFNWTGEYTLGNDRINPQDVFFTGFGIEYIKNNNLSYLAEFIYNKYSESLSINDITQTGTSGTNSYIFFGMRYKTGSIKAKAGISLPSGDMLSKEYDYKVILGLSYVLGIFAM